LIDPSSNLLNNGTQLSGNGTLESTRYVPGTITGWTEP
jgi:hypothetical protein